MKRTIINIGYKIIKRERRMTEMEKWKQLSLELREKTRDVWPKKIYT